MNLFFTDNLGVIAPGVWLVAGALPPASRPRPPVFLVGTPSHECCVTQSPVWRCEGRGTWWVVVMSAAGPEALLCRDAPAWHRRVSVLCGVSVCGPRVHVGAVLCWARAGGHTH